MISVVDDYLTIIFWSVTYLLIICASYRSRKIKKVSMPYIAGVANIAWEISALYWVSGFWGYFLWLAIDLVIVYFGFCFLDSNAKRISYIASIIISTIGLIIAFHKITDSLIYSVYAIDLLMAICYLVERKKMSSELKIPVAIAKLLGDFFAGFVFKRFTFVVVIAIVVFVCNSVYLYQCVREKNTYQTMQVISK